MPEIEAEDLSSYCVNDYVLIKLGRSQLPAIIETCNQDSYSVRFYEKSRRREFGFQPQSSSYDIDHIDILSTLAEPETEDLGNVVFSTSLTFKHKI